MSVVFVVALPAITAGWPMIAAAVSAACAAAGYTARRVDARRSAAVEETSVERHIEMEMAKAEVIGEALAREQTFQVEKDGVVATFSKNARGKLSLHVDGERTREELSAIGTELLNGVRQQYAAEKVKAELLKQGFVLVEEHVDEEQSIRLSVRRFT
jgi:hypothetical protein